MEPLWPQSFCLSSESGQRSGCDTTAVCISIVADEGDPFLPPAMMPAFLASSDLQLTFEC